MLNDNNPPSSSLAPVPQDQVVPTSRELFLGFLGLGMTAFGGALPLAHRMVVERHRWLTEAEFVELLGLCQFLPGGNIINLSVALGMRFRGVKGALKVVDVWPNVDTAGKFQLGLIGGDA